MLLIFIKRETTGMCINMETFTIWGQKKERQVTEEYIKTNKALCMVIYISSKARRKKE